MNDLQSSHKIVPGPIQTKGSAVSDALLLDDILELNFKPKPNLNVKLTEDKEVPRISGCEFLSTGELLLYDHRNDQLKLLDYCLVVQSSLALDEPHDVSLLDGNTAGVTMPFKRKLQYVKPALAADKPFHLTRNAGELRQLVMKFSSHVIRPCHHTDQATLEFWIFRGTRRGD